LVLEVSDLQAHECRLEFDALLLGRLRRELSEPHSIRKGRCQHNGGRYGASRTCCAPLLNIIVAASGTVYTENFRSRK
jgi:hypothetical protein